MKKTVELWGMTRAASELGVHHLTLRRWVSQGKLPCIRDTYGRRFFRRADIEKLARERGVSQ